MKREVFVYLLIFFSPLIAQPDSLHTYCAKRVILINTGQGICTFGNYIYVACGTSGLEYFDIQNPWKPESVCVYGTTQRFNDCFIDPFLGLFVPNMTVDYVQLDPTPCPTSAIGFYDHPSANFATGIGGNAAFLVVAEQSDGIFIWNPGMGTTYVYSTPSPAYCVTVDNIYAYVGCGTGLFVYDCNDGSQVGSYLCGRINSIYIEDSFAYVGNLNTMRILKISNPASIVEVGHYTLPATASIQGVAVDKSLYHGFIFCAAGNEGLWIIDRFYPDSIRCVGRYKPGGYCKDVCLNGQFIYTIIDNYLYVLKHYVIPHWDGWSFLNVQNDMWYTDGRVWPMWEDFRDAFGQSICETPDGSKRPTALRYYHTIGRTNSYEWNGSCYGMANMMMGVHDNFWVLNGADWNPGDSAYAFKVPINDTLRHLINSIFLYQFGNPAFGHWIHWRNKPSGIVRRWHRDYLDSLFVLGIPEPGHEVTPFRLTQQNDALFSIELYDPNTGTAINYILLDTITQRYNYAGNGWMNPDSFKLELCPVDYVYVRPRFSYEYISSRAGPNGLLIFTNLKGRTIVYEADGDSLGSNDAGVFISDTANTGWVIGRAVGDITNPNCFWLINATDARVKMRVISGDTINCCFITSNNGILDFTVSNMNPADIFRFRLHQVNPNAIRVSAYLQSVASPSSQKSINLAGVMGAQNAIFVNNAFQVNGLSIAFGETLIFTISDTMATIFSIQRRGSGTKSNIKYSITFEHCDSLSPTVYNVHSADSIILTSSETDSFRVSNWNNLTSTSIYLYKDLGNNGSIDSTILLSVIVGVSEQCETPQITFYGNFPNPFNSSTKIVYNVPIDGYVKLEVLDITGKCVAVLVDDNETAGIKFSEWDAKNNSSGIYFARLTTLKGVNIHRMVLVK